MDRIIVTKYSLEPPPKPIILNDVLYSEWLNVDSGRHLVWDGEKWKEKTMKTKQEEWSQFSMEVENHIVNYVLPQYGDYPDEAIDSWTVEHIKSELEKYVKRIGADVRGAEESVRDTFKMAHYACYLLKFLRMRKSDE